jgi:hypothetical protein
VILTTAAILPQLFHVKQLSLAKFTTYGEHERLPLLSVNITAIVCRWKDVSTGKILVEVKLRKNHISAAMLPCYICFSLQYMRLRTHNAADPQRLYGNHANPAKKP